MGTGHSSAAEGRDEPFLLHCKEMYYGLRHDCSSPVSFKERFLSLFGGPSIELGEKLYRLCFCTTDTNSDCLAQVDYDLFVAGMTKLRLVLSQGSEEMCRFLLSLFLSLRNTLEVDVQLLVHTAASCSLHIGLSSDLPVERDHPLLSALVAAMVKYDRQHQQSSEVGNVLHWLTTQSPQMLTGLSQWLHAIIEPTSEQRPAYHLPVVECKDRESQLQLNVFMWVLSSVLPAVYLGSSVVINEFCLPCGGSWTHLYSSRDHGFSMNRFQYHCFDYKQPSIMIINCTPMRDDQQYSFALAMDSEWRDGSYFFGGTNFYFLQLQPSYSLLKKGAKLVSLNEKQRGFPSGLRVMASQKHEYSLFEVKSSLEEARFQEGEWMQVQLVEVWGCGGVQAKDTQRRIKEWERREVLRRREIHAKTTQTAWEDNPDRYLLEMGGVGTLREQKTSD